MKRQILSFENNLKDNFNTAIKEENFYEFSKKLSFENLSIDDYSFILKKTHYYCKNVYMRDDFLAMHNNAFAELIEILFQKLNVIFDEKDNSEVMLKWLQGSLKQKINKISKMSYIIVNVINIVQFFNTYFSTKPINYILLKINQIIHSIEQEFKLEKYPRNSVSKSMSIMLYNLRNIASFSTLDAEVSLELINPLLVKLKDLGEFTSQSISISLYGLGELAKAGKARGEIEAKVINLLLKQLNYLLHVELQPKSQHMSVSLYGIGELAKAGSIRGEIDVEAINLLLTTLNNLEYIESRHISMSLYGIGELSKVGKMQGEIEAEVINLLLIRLNKLNDLDNQGIGSSLYGVGESAKAGKIQGEVAAEAINLLLNRLTNLNDPNDQAISMSLYGVGELAKAGKIQGELAAETINLLLTRLKDLYDLHDQGIAMSLYGIGELVKAGKIQGEVRAEPINFLLNRLIDLNNLTSQSISMSLYGIGELARIRKIQGKVLIKVVTSLLIKLQDLQDLNYQDIGMSLQAIGELAKTEKIQGEMFIESIEAINKLLVKMLDDNNLISICKTLLGIEGITVLLKNNKKMINHLRTDLIIRLFSKVATLLNSNALVQFDIEFPLHPLGLAYQSLFAITQLIANQFLSDKDLPLPQVKTLFEMIANTYKHPQKSAQIIHLLVQFKDHYVELFPIFNQFVQNIATVPLTRFSYKIQQQLADDFKALKNTPWGKPLYAVLKSRLNDDISIDTEAAITTEKTASGTIYGSQKNADGQRSTKAIQYFPTRVSHQTTTHFTKFVNSTLKMQTHLRNERNHTLSVNSQNLHPIIQAMNGGVDHLRAYLHTHHLSFPEVGNDPRNKMKGYQSQFQSTNPNSYFPASAKKNNVESSVWHFFFNTSQDTWIELIQQCSDHRFYIALLQVFSAHRRYQLGQLNGLLPIISHLPLIELKCFLDLLDSPYQFYRDHKTLLCIIDNLTIRHDRNEAEQKNIFALQEALFKKAIQFHIQCNHYHVVNALQISYKNLINKTFTFVDDEVENTCITFDIQQAKTTLSHSSQQKMQVTNEGIFNSTMNPKYLSAENMQTIITSNQSKGLTIKFKWNAAGVVYQMEDTSNKNTMGYKQ